MNGGPFKFDNSEPTILKRSALEKMIKRFGGRLDKTDKKADEKAEKKPPATGIYLPARVSP
jgi:hypothetical protein